MAVLEKVQERIKFETREKIVTDPDSFLAVDVISKRTSESSCLAKSKAEVAFSLDLVFVPFIKDFIGIDYRPRKGIFIDGTKCNTTGRSNSRGCISSRIGSLTIEFKHRDKLKKDNGIDKAVLQTQAYLGSLRLEGN